MPTSLMYIKEEQKLDKIRNLQILKIVAKHYFKYSISVTLTKYTKYFIFVTLNRWTV